MPHFVAAEQYGFPLSDQSPNAVSARAGHLCPFQRSRCNKPGGVCSITDGVSYPITCPNRFKEDDLIYGEAGYAVFGTRTDLVALKEIPFLEAHDQEGAAPGRIDNVLAHYANGELKDWCALEVQAVYFSGAGMEAEMTAYTRFGTLPSPQTPLRDGRGRALTRRPDYRSSAPKRLLPQLEIKVPTLRRWGKKMCVAVDQPFFNWMPRMEPANHLSNADVIWLTFRLDTSVTPYKLVRGEILPTTLEESRQGLIAATIPPKPQVEVRIEQIISRGLAGHSPEVNKIQWRDP